MMTGSVLPEVENLTDKFVDLLHNRGWGQGDSPLRLVGRPTAGKSTLLRLVKKRLEDAGEQVILIAPPVDEWDGGISIATQLAASLEVLGSRSAKEVTLDIHRPWSDKLASLRREAEKYADDVILLLDEAGRTASGEELDDSPFGRCTDEAWQLLAHGITWRRLIVPGQWADPDEGRFKVLQVCTSGRALLDSQAQWNGLSQIAQELAARATSDLTNHSLLELRLLVAIALLTSVDHTLELIGRSRRELSASLISILLKRPELDGLRRIWGQLALVRVPFEADLLARLGAEELSSSASQILQQCLLSKTEGGFELHETLRRDALHMGAAHLLDGDETKSTRELLVDHHVERFRSLARHDPQRAVIERGEAFEHAVLGGDASRADELKRGFIEELDILGKTLSKRWRRYQEAADVFHRVIDIAPDHAYAHHYYAYNLDILGKQPGDVEEHYRRAIDLEPHNAWWHGRLIGFYITRGRIKDARKQYSMALDALLPIDDDKIELWLYKNLHMPIARLLLHRTRLDFAREVLGVIPSAMRKDIPWIPELWNRLVALEQVREHGAVFPGHLEPTGWWSKPYLFRQHEPRKGTLQGWWPGRVLELEHDARVVRLWVGTPPDSEHSEPRYGELEVSFDDFDSLSEHETSEELDEDRFLEIALFKHGKGEERVIRVHELVPSLELPRIFPPPDRYLRNWRPL